MDGIKVVVSQKGCGWLREYPEVRFEEDVNHQEMELIMIYSDIGYQEIHGFGGAFTPSAADTYDSMNESCQEEIINALFSENGLRYNCGRGVIGACDFSRGNYSYCDGEDDMQLRGFTTEEDRKTVIPMMKRAMTVATADFTMLSSPWSPPAWMKTNHCLTGGGKLKRECYGVWADYIVRYLADYRQEGIEITYLTIQNEPQAVQRWESCIYDADEEKTFLRDYLYPKLQNAGFGHVKVIIWDHNKEAVFLRARSILQGTAKDMVGGIAFHWYSGDHFENLSLCREFFPEKELIFTEGCVELSAGTTMAIKANRDGAGTVEEAPYEYGECYGHDMIGNFNHGMNRFLDWNLILDSQGGPNHVGNYCSAPVICDVAGQRIFMQPSYYFIAHMSRFVKPGARRIAWSRYTDKLEVTAFRGEEGVTVVIMNSCEEDVDFVLKDVTGNRLARMTSGKKSIMTLCYECGDDEPALCGKRDGSFLEL